MMELGMETTYAALNSEAAHSQMTPIFRQSSFISLRYMIVDLQLRHRVYEISLNLILCFYWLSVDVNRLVSPQVCNIDAPAISQCNRLNRKCRKGAGRVNAL